MDKHGNLVAREGCDRCTCGCKYWENDRCIDCQTPINEIRRCIAWEAATGQRCLNPDEKHGLCAMHLQED